jgi:hypothetical protein
VRSEALARRVPRGATYGYDVEVHVGLERFVRYRQREEIRVELADKHGISVSTGEISVLEGRFLRHLEALHESRAPALRAAMTQDGGYPLHIDATGEDGRGTVFVAYAGWSGWALGSWKLSTERAEQIYPHLEDVIASFGPPVAIVRDLGRAVSRAARKLVDGLPHAIPILSCHQHFLSDVGKDLLGAPYDRLRELFRRFGVRGDLRALARDLGRRLGRGMPALRADVARWAEEGGSHTLPAGLVGLATVRSVVQWVLDYANDGRGRGFPFDRPYVKLYERCLSGRRAIDAFLRTPPTDTPVLKAAHRAARLLDPILCEVPFAQVATSLRERAALFDELRDVLRLDPTDSKADGGALPPKEDAAELDAIHTALNVFTRNLRARRPERGPAQDTRKAIDLVLDHLDRHGQSLFGHAIRLPPELGGGIRLVDRTNNAQEGFWHAMKHGERRRSGRKVLTRDFECLPAAAALARNLTHADYVALLCGSMQNLPTAFADLDLARRADHLRRPPRSVEVPDAPTSELASASLPTIDRRIVRAPKFRERVEAAARSRAPRWVPPQRPRAPATPHYDPSASTTAD